MISNIDNVELVRTLQAFVIQARVMAYWKESYENIATILDDMDHLCNLICDEQDQTIAFRKGIQKMIQKAHSSKERRYLLSSEILEMAKRYK